MIFGGGYLGLRLITGKLFSNDRFKENDLEVTKKIRTVLSYAFVFSAVLGTIISLPMFFFTFSYINTLCFTAFSSIELIKILQKYSATFRNLVQKIEQFRLKFAFFQTNLNNPINKLINKLMLPINTKIENSFALRLLLYFSVYFVLNIFTLFTNLIAALTSFLIPGLACCSMGFLIIDIFFFDYFYSYLKKLLLDDIPNNRNHVYQGNEVVQHLEEQSFNNNDEEEIEEFFNGNNNNVPPLPVAQNNNYIPGVNFQQDTEEAQRRSLEEPQNDTTSNERTSTIPILDTILENDDKGKVIEITKMPKNEIDFYIPVKEPMTNKIIQVPISKNKYLPDKMIDIIIEQAYAHRSKRLEKVTFSNYKMWIFSISHEESHEEEGKIVNEILLHSEIRGKEKNLGQLKKGKSKLIISIDQKTASLDFNKETFSFTCPISYNEIPRDHVVFMITCCSKVLDRRCLKEALKEKSLCPLCKNPITSEDKKKVGIY